MWNVICSQGFRMVINLCFLHVARYFGQIDVSVTFAAFVVAMALLLQRGIPRFAQLSSAMFGLFYCGYLPCFWVKLRCGLSVPALNTSKKLRVIHLLQSIYIEGDLLKVTQLSFSFMLMFSSYFVVFTIITFPLTKALNFL